MIEQLPAEYSLAFKKAYGCLPNEREKTFASRELYHASFSLLFNDHDVEHSMCNGFTFMAADSIKQLGFPFPIGFSVDLLKK